MASTAAWAHGEEVFSTLGLVVISFFACVVTLGTSKKIASHKSAAAAGLLAGVGIFVWPFGQLPYVENEALLNLVGLVAPPTLMLLAVAVSAIVQARARRDGQAPSRHE